MVYMKVPEQLPTCMHYIQSTCEEIVHLVGDNTLFHRSKMLMKVGYRFNAFIEIKEVEFLVG